VAAWDGDEQAWAELKAVAERRPLDGGPVAWCRWVAAHLDDSAAIERFGSWAGTLEYSDLGLPAVARIVRGSVQPLPGYILDRYGSIYRRGVIAKQVVSLLPQIEWVDHA
jgi:hypothetical protein